jgi:hypothetical protein
MFPGSRHLGKILGYSFLPIKFHLSLLGSLASRGKWRHLAATVGTSRKREGVNRVYKKPNGFIASRALPPGPDQQQQQQQSYLNRFCGSTSVAHTAWRQNFTKYGFTCKIDTVVVWKGRCCIEYVNQLHFKFVGLSQTLPLSVQFGPK